MSARVFGARPARAAARTNRALCLVVAGVVTTPSVAYALDPEKTVYQFNCQNWTRLAGLPADKISTIAQTPDGYIWLGSQNGLVRFDGAEFKVIPVTLPEAQGQDVRGLQATPDGRLWFVINAGGYGQYDGHTFSPVGDARWSAPDANGTCIFRSPDGTVWTGSVFGWGRWSPDNPQRSVFDDKLGPTISITQDISGRIWLATAERGLRYWEDNALKEYPSEILKERNVRTVLRDLRGDLWVATNIGLYHYDASDKLLEVLWPDEQTNALLLDRHGVLWAGTNSKGLARYQDGRFTFFQKSDGLSGNSITSLFEDAEGSIWIGTVDGLSQLTDLKFPLVSSHEGILPGEVLDLCASAQGGLWVGTTVGVSYLNGKTTLNINDPALTPNLWIRRIYEARDGRLFVADGSKNINVLREGRLLFRIANESWPESFAEDADGVIIGIGPQLFRLAGERLVPFPFVGAAPTLDWVNQLRITRDGALWAATNSGLFRIEHGRFQRWSIENGLPTNRVHFILEDEDGSIWAGSSGGMFRLKEGKLSRVSTEQGLTDPRIYAIVPDDRGGWWLSSGRGILHTTRSSMIDVAEGRAKRLDCQAYDGLESVKFTDRTEQGPSGCRTGDGRVWFPNPRGVVMIDPARYSANKVPPRVHLDRVVVNGTPRDPAQLTALQSSDRRLEFHFVALSYIAPKKIRAQYQLAGFDADWIDAGTRRSASYSNLAPGRYTFRVRAANADGVWSETDAAYAFELPPPFYQTLWFYAMAGLGLGGLVLAGYRWKLRHFRRTQEKLQAQNDLLEAKVGRRTDELAHSLSLLKATLDSTADGILAVEFARDAVTYNRQFTTMWDIPPEKMAQSSKVVMRDLLAPKMKDPATFLARIEAIKESPVPESFDLLELADGRVFERYIKPQRAGGAQVGLVINFRDITERKRAESIIAESSALLESLLSHTLDVVYFKDRDSRFVRYSDSILKLYGLTDREALRGKSDFDLFPPELARRFFHNEQEIIRTGRPMIDRLERTRNSSGQPAWVITTKMPWRDASGKIIGTFGVARDVTALKDAELGLAHERDLLRAILDGSPDQIYFKDVESRFLRCSHALAKNFGMKSPDELVGKRDADFFTSEHAQRAYEDEQEIIRTGQPLIGKIEKEVWRDGRETWALTSKMPLRDNTGAIIGTFGISKDITPLKEAELKLEQIHKQLLETSRQAGMAEVATSVLHNVGNVLNSVNVSATLVAEQVSNSKASFVPRLSDLIQERAADLGAFLTTDPKGRKIPSYLQSLGKELMAERGSILEELSQLRKNIEHIKDIVAMQQNFAKISGVSETLPLVEIVEDAIRINASALTRHEIELVRDFQVQPVLTTERHKVMQVLVNLIRNAKYACDEAGRSDKRITIRIAQQDDRVLLSVIDNGVGIPAENLTRIFSHGFTTRKEGHGFGLHSGANSAREIGGHLTAHSAGAGQGATFTLELPLTPPPSAPSA